MTVRRRSVIVRRWGSNLRTFRHNKLAVAGVVILVMFALTVVVQPILWSTVWEGKRAIYDPATGYDAVVRQLTVVDEVLDPSTEIKRSDAQLDGFLGVEIGDIIEKPRQPAPPSSEHWFGTDPFGRDVFSMTLAGAVPAFVVGITAAVTTGLLATLVAASSAIYGRLLDAVLSRIADIALLLPAPLAMIIIGAGAFGGDLRPFWFGFMYGVIAGMGGGAIVLRSHALSILGRPYIDAARVAGAGRLRIMGRHLLPHLVPLAGVTMFTAVAGAVIAHGFAAWLAFADDVVNWGAMMFMGLSLLGRFGGQTAWNVLLAGALAISLFSASFYLISLGIRDVALPHSRARARRQPHHLGP
ncbi:MAG: ABC transporter permease subunit [Acidimicrobiia bacterium]|nr:ABC transporter permease subunit [Acidimicrobiia bacterium]NNF11290.1 ABC transporter permease subunit [Acidimicrobiia bacterium]NNL68377.1 ABC transporter permease subunit [Acidimicrobiia bacterium]